MAKAGGLYHAEVQPSNENAPNYDSLFFWSARIPK